MILLAAVLLSPLVLLAAAVVPMEKK